MIEYQEVEVQIETLHVRGCGLKFFQEDTCDLNHQKV